MTCATQRKKPETVTIDGKFLTRSRSSIKIETVIGDAWIPKSQIFDSDEDLDDLYEGDDVTIEIPKWLAKKEGWVS
jgi:hypothetical protein